MRRRRVKRCRRFGTLIIIHTEPQHQEPERFAEWLKEFLLELLRDVLTALILSYIYSLI